MLTQLKIFILRTLVLIFKKIFILKIIFLVNIEGSHKTFYAMSAKKFYGDIPYGQYYITDKLVWNKTLDILVLSLCTSH